MKNWSDEITIPSETEQSPPLAGVLLVDLVGVPATLVPFEVFKGVFLADAAAAAVRRVDGVRGASLSGVFVGLGIFQLLQNQLQDLQFTMVIVQKDGRITSTCA